MTPKLGSFTQPSTGDVTVNVGFPPSFLRFTVSQLYGTPENTVAHLSIGATDGTIQHAHSIYSNRATNDAFTRFHNNYCVTHHAIVNNTFKRVISASLVALTTNGFTLNFDRADSDYQITFEAYP